MSSTPEAPIEHARWTVDGETLRAFVQQMRERYQANEYPPKQLLAVYDAHAQTGIDIVFTSEMVCVGPNWRLRFQYTGVSAVRLQDSWVQFELEGGPDELPVPLARNGRAAGERLVAAYRAQGDARAREALAEREAPTWNNRLLNMAERHFVKLTLALFFVVLPLLIFLLDWLHSRLA